jgi:hypothetical protein
MSDLELVVRNAHVATAADVFDCDIGVKVSMPTAISTSR